VERWARALRTLGGYLPTRRLALVVALTAVVWLVAGRTHVVAVALPVLALLALIVVLDALTIPAAWQVDVERHVPATLGIGDDDTGSYVLHSLVHAPFTLRVFDQLPRAVRPPGERPAASAHSRPPQRLVPDRELRLPIALTGRERGLWPLGPIALRVRSRLGLVQRALRYQPDDSLLVTPSMTGVRRYRLLTLHHRLRDAGVRSVRRRGQGSTFSNLREYVRGDDPRRIDWKATARRHKLISREYTVEQGQTVMIAVDAGRMMTQLAGDLPRFEYALSSATLLADVAVQSRDEVGLLLFDDQVRAFVPAARGADALERIRRALIPAVATMAEPDYAAAFRVLGERHRKRSLVVLFTDVIDARASQSLIALTARSAARHLLVVVALRNDQLMAAAQPGAESSATGLFESAAAEELVLAREDALTRMRRAGVSVLDVSPHVMTPAVINRYLEIKARSSL
jgi:uncharacterized protein (DUF58 family)